MTADNKTLTVDVLAVMEQAHATLKGLAYASELTGDHVQADAMLAAHAAVAELIDVYEELLNELREISDEAGQEPYNNPRANAALARVKGESA